jgi:ABC-2 type transport system ATP-binding protein
MNDVAVELKDVTKRYGHRRVLDGLSFTLRQGTCLGILGPNGAGKTTILRLVAGIARTTSGTVRVFGGDPLADPERVKAQIGYVAEDFRFPDLLKPWELFSFFSDCYPTWDQPFALSLMDRFRIPLHRRLSTLSKGERRQVELICAMAHHPRLLVLDEPTGGLDPIVRRAFLQQLVEYLSAQDERSILLSSHHTEDVERLADRVAFLGHGRILLEDEIDRLREGSCQVSAELPETDADRIRSALEGCLSAERRRDAWILTFLCPERAARDRVAACGGRVHTVRPLTLDDLILSLRG